MLRSLLLLAAAVSSQAAAGTSEDPCVPSSGTGTSSDPYIFNAKINFFQSSTGYYTFENCDGSKPTLKVVEGKEYKFDQSDESNWNHPFGFAYYPDGAYGRDGMQDELELATTPPGSNSDCAASFSCQSPMYYNGDVFLRSQSGYVLGARRSRIMQGRKLLEESSGADESYEAAADFGLDNYEPQFFQAFDRWVAEGEAGGGWNVRLKITDPNTSFFYYFCHIHRYMSGKIEVYNADGTKRSDDTNGAGNPADQFFYPPYEPSARDSKCGYTAEPKYDDLLGPDAFGVGAGKCDNRALCGAENDFILCMEDIDCHMEYNMRIPHSSSSKMATFARQMIAHHQNAVNMVKVMWKLASEEVEASGLKYMMYSIHNSQNHQIMELYDWLREHQGKGWEAAEIYDEDCAKDLEKTSFGDWNSAGVGFGIGFLLAALLTGMFCTCRAMTTSPQEPAKMATKTVDSGNEIGFNTQTPQANYHPALSESQGQYAPQQPFYQQAQQMRYPDTSLPQV